jgi:NitT/TauT family transport system substrate-binding protein
MAGRTTALLLMVILPLLSPSIASGQSPLSEKHPSPPVTPREQTVLNIVYGNISVSAAPLWITQRAGIFQKHGFDARLSFARGTLATQAVIAGSFPVAILSPPSVVNSVLAGTRIKMVAGLIDKLGYMVVSARHITNPFQLKGKRAGISSFGATSETATRFAARELGLDPDRDLVMLQIGNSSARFAALASGNIEWMVADPADVVPARRQGYNILLDLTTRGIDYQVSAVVMTEDFIRNQRETALRFMRALIEGIHYFKTKREETIKVAADHLKTQDFDAVAFSWQVHAERLVPSRPYPSAKGMQIVIKEVASQNPLARNSMPEQFFDTSIIDEVDRSGFIDRLYR